MFLAWVDYIRLLIREAGSIVGGRKRLLCIHSSYTCKNENMISHGLGTPEGFGG
jgi:hypothetical protein